MDIRVSVLGVGAIGSVVAAALATTDVELHLHVRGERGAAQMLQGVAVSGHRTLSPSAARFLFSCEELPVDDGLLQGSDLVILACKSSDVPHLAQTATSFLKTGGVVLALCNGLGHVEALTRIHGPSAVIAASTTHGAYAEGEGVVWAGFGGVGFAAPPLGPDAKRLEAVVSLFEAAELNPWIHEDAATLIWEKVVLNLAINPIAALAGLTNGELLESGLFNACMMVYREAAQVAAMERVSLADEPAFERRLRTVLEQTADNTCSMLQDLKKGRKTEISALNQAVVALAEGHGLSVPINQTLASLIQACHP